MDLQAHTAQVQAYRTFYRKNEDPTKYVRKRDANERIIVTLSLFAPPFFHLIQYTYLWPLFKTTTILLKRLSENVHLNNIASLEGGIHSRWDHSLLWRGQTTHAVPTMKQPPAAGRWPSHFNPRPWYFPTLEPVTNRSRVFYFHDNYLLQFWKIVRLDVDLAMKTSHQKMLLQ